MPIQNAVHFLQQIDINSKSYPCFEIEHSKILLEYFNVSL